MLIRVAGLLLLLVSFFMASALGTGWVIDSSVETAVDLNATNFDYILKETPASFAIVEFFGHRCPACRNYKLRVFNGPAAAHPSMVLMARVDCALKLNNKLCDDFSVTHYPMLLWGPPSKFGSGWKPKQDKSDLILIDNGRTADRLLGWINKQLRSSYDLDDEKFENDYLMPSTSDPEQINNAEYDIEEATFTEHKEWLFLGALLICRCFCRGSRNNTRGFSCGFWVLLHSLSLRVEDEESQFAFKAICVFIHNFFICEECRLHFYGMCSSVSDPFTKTHDFSLWLWEAHNKVNERLMKEEAALGYNDPNFPKIIWPPEQLCSSCSSSHFQKESAADLIESNKDEVYKVLSDYYGKKLVSLYKDKDSL